MKYEEGIKLVLKYTNAFHDRYNQSYGQVILRIDDDTYLMTKENLLLSDIRESDISAFDINTGDIGKIMNSRNEINSLVFMVTEASVKFSKDNAVMKPALDDLAQIVGPDVSVIENSKPENVIPAIAKRNGCFIKGSGILAVGGTLDTAIAAGRILEKSAEAEMYGDKLKGLAYLDSKTAQILSNNYNNSYSQTNMEEHVPFFDINEEEFELRNKIIECCKEMCRRDLVQGTWGNASIRLNEHEMLITPSSMDYFSLGIEDIVKVDIKTLTYGKQRVPSSESGIHAGIYAVHPEYKAILHTHSNGCSVFAAANAGFRIENPELHKIIGDLHVTKHQMIGTKELSVEILNALTESNACIIANHGSLFCGENLDDILSIADAVDQKACSLIGLGK